MRLLFPMVMAFLALGWNSIAAETAALTQTRSTLEQWVQTRQLISKTKSDWQTDKETLEQTISLFERELKTVDEQMSKVATNNLQVAREKQDAEALLKSSNAALDRAREFATTTEAQVRKLATQLPGPLQDILKPLLTRLPADPANTKMLAAERVQIIVGVINELDKFNNAVNVFSEKLKNPKGEEVAVETVYVGLGAAYFVNESGDFAGLGVPGNNGWQWTTRSELAPTVKEVVRIYRNERPARFVTLPATVH